MYIQQLVHIQAAFAKLSSTQLEAVKEAHFLDMKEQEFKKLFPVAAQRLESLHEQVCELSANETLRAQNRIALSKLCEKEFSVWLEALASMENKPSSAAMLFIGKAKPHLQQAIDHYYQYISNSTADLDTEILREYLRLAFIIMLNHCVARQESKIEHTVRFAETVIKKFAAQDPSATLRIILESCNEQEQPSMAQGVRYVQLPQQHIAVIRDLTKLIPEPLFPLHDGQEMLFTIYRNYGFTLADLTPPEDIPPTGKYAVDQTGPRAGQPKLKFL